MTCEACHTTADFEEVAYTHPADAVGGQCRSCHLADDPHAGQFDDRGCASCHSTSSFALTVFDHTDTAFPLEGAHAQATCAACHRTETGPVTSFIRFRPLGTACTDCHGVDR
jgi:hypothetical protein